jgi:hypothetical protein
MTNKLTSDVKFSIVPDWVIEGPISDRAVRVYAILARYADNDSLQCFPSRQTIADRARCNVKAVTKAIDELVSIGAVSREHRKTGDAYQSNLYTLRRVGPDLTLGGVQNDPRVGSDLTLGRVSDDPLTRTTELEPKNDNHLTKPTKSKTADDYEPSDEFLQKLGADFPGVRLEIELEKFRDHHMAAGSRFAVWDRAFRKWIRQASEWSPTARAARVQAEEEAKWAKLMQEEGLE